jgi:tetratricopeptide (TPR) repeat protein
VATLCLGQARAEAQIPDTFRNLQVLPEDTDRAVLLDVMRGFSFALGVRCQYCHVGGDGVSFEGVAFDRDDDPDKLKARAMLAMVGDLNDVVLAALPQRDTPPVAVECKTCHRGRPRPVLLARELRVALDDFGPDSATARYERFRADEDVVLAGWFDFGEWEVNTLAERLQDEGRTADAIAIYELNARHHPRSISIHSRLGALHEAQGDTRAAILSYERVLEIDPENQAAVSRLRALRGGGPGEAHMPAGS